jgi:type I restriction enzyme S subunit
MVGNLPKNWIETDLETIIQRMSNGSGLKQFEEPFENSFPISRIETIWNETIDLNRVKYVNPTKVDIEKYSFLKGDVLFSHINSDKHLGKTAVFNLDSILIHGINLLLLRAQPQFNGYLLNYFLRYYRLTGKFIEVAQRSVNQSSINQKKLNTFKIPLPPLAEQNRIVDKLDRLFTQLETIKTSMANIPLLLKDFRQQVLTQAVTGKLTEEWRKGKELEKVKLITQINVIEFNVINFLSTPQDWTHTALGNYAIISRGKFTPRPRNDPKYFDGKYPFMQIGDLPREGGVTSAFTKTLNELGKDVSKSFKKNTVAIAIVGATIGNTGILDKEMYFPDSIIGINCLNEISNIYVEFFLRVCKYGLREISYSSGGQPNINTQVVKNLEIALPPLEEQQEIVNRVESLFAKADAIEQQYKTLKASIDTLPQAFLHKSFKGELSEQLDSDGDARELLQQIMELKNSAVKPKKATAKKVKNYPEGSELLGMVAETN